MLFFGGSAGDELAHDAADHIQVDIQHDIAKIIFVVGAVGLAAQQAPLLAAAEDKAQAAAVGVV